MTEILFDFYNLLVNNIFGSVFLSIFGVLFVILLILFITRTSSIFIINWMIFYLIVMGTAYLGALGLIIGVIGALVYFGIAVIRFIGRVD